MARSSDRWIGQRNGMLTAIKNLGFRKTEDGIDRVDNTKGYILNNVVPACKECNSLKSGVTIDIAKKMLKFLGLLND